MFSLRSLKYGSDQPFIQLFCFFFQTKFSFNLTGRLRRLNDPETLRTYYRLLEEGHTENNRIRLMVVGMYEVGKTSLVKNLVQNLNEHTQDVRMQGRESTEGIDVHLCEINECNTWKKLKSKRNQTQITNVLKTAQKAEQQSGDALQTELKKEHAPLTEGEYKLRGVMAKELQEGLKPTQDCPLISVWDFAGQNMYNSTHHFFLNERSIYLLLMDMTQDINSSETKQKEIMDVFKFWINSIHMYSTLYDTDKEIKPTIILVGTHKDQINAAEDEKHEYMARYFNKALEPFLANQEIMKRINQKKFLVNNLNASDPEYDHIRKEVKRLAEEQSFWNEKQPLKFVQLETAFDEVRRKGKEILTYTDVQELNKTLPAPLKDDTDLISFLRLQHMFGNVLFFDTDALRNHVIVSPEWILKAFKCFINHKDEHIPHELRHQWNNEYRKYAKLSRDLLENILRYSSYKLDHHVDVLISYLEHLNVMAKPICPEEYPENENCTEEDPSTIDRSARKVNRQQRKHCDFYVVPCQLQPKPDADIEKLTNPKNWETSHALCFVFKDKFMPPATFHRLLVACMREWEIAKTNDTFMLYNNFGAFKTSDRSQLRLWYYDHIIYAKMVFQSTKTQGDDAIDTDHCQNNRRILYENLMAILGLLPRSSNMNKTTPFEEYIQCRKLIKHNIGLVKVNDCRVKDEFVCADGHEDDESHSMNRRDVLKFWYKDTLAEIDDNRDRDFDRLPTEKDLAKVAQSLENMKEIWLLGIELGVPMIRLEQIKMNSKRNHGDFILHVLREWRNKQEALPKLRKAIIAVQKHQDHFFDIYDNLDVNDPSNPANNDGHGSQMS